MIALMLHDARVEALRLAFLGPAFHINPAIANVVIARNHTGETREREASFHVLLHALTDRLDLRVDQDRGRLDGGRRRRVVHPAVVLLLSRLTARRHAKEHESQRHMHLGGCQTGPVRVHQRIDHVVDQARDRRRSRIVDRKCRAAQHGMAHARDLENCHAP